MPFDELIEDVQFWEEELSEEEGAGDDYNHVVKNLNYAAVDSGGREEVYNALCEEAAKQVKDWWPQICAVGEQLIQTGYLDGEECEMLIEEATL